MKKRGIILFLFIINFVYFTSSQEIINKTNKDLASICLNESDLIIERLQNKNFSIQRVNDTLKEAKLIFLVQEEIEKKGLTTNYEKIFSACEEIKKIEEMAYSTKDQLRALEKFYEEHGKGITSEEIERLFSEIRKEIQNERYELVPELIEKTYSEISAEQARKTLIATYYSATTAGIKSFLEKRKKEIIATVIAIIFLIMVLRRPIKRHIIKQKIKYLKLRREKLKEMIAKNQDDYFNKGKISEIDFEVKNKKFAEIVRDINRQIPLLEEQLKKTGEKNGTESTKNKKR
ncbi:MAG: hypothetical protein QW103_02895 [Candidatus Pacearchaeota archaeon]